MVEMTGTLRKSSGARSTYIATIRSPGTPAATAAAISAPVEVPATKSKWSRTRPPTLRSSCRQRHGRDHAAHAATIDRQDSPRHSISLRGVRDSSATSSRVRLAVTACEIHCATPTGDVQITYAMRQFGPFPCRMRAQGPPR